MVFNGNIAVLWVIKQAAAVPTGILGQIAFVLNEAGDFYHL
jgi:hypothetical protein